MVRDILNLLKRDCVLTSNSISWRQSKLVIERNQLHWNFRGACKLFLRRTTAQCGFDIIKVPKSHRNKQIYENLVKAFKKLKCEMARLTDFCFEIQWDRREPITVGVEQYVVCFRALRRNLFRNTLAKDRPPQLIMLCDVIVFWLPFKKAPGIPSLLLKYVPCARRECYPWQR